MKRLMDLQLFYHWGDVKCLHASCLSTSQLHVQYRPWRLTVYHDSSLVIGAPLNCSNCLFFIRVFFSTYIVVGGCTLYLNITFNFLVFHCDTPAHRILSSLKCKYTAYIYGYNKKKLVFSTKQPTENVQMK